MYKETIQYLQFWSFIGLGSWAFGWTFRWCSLNGPGCFVIVEGHYFSKLAQCMFHIEQVVFLLTFLFVDISIDI